MSNDPIIGTKIKRFFEILKDIFLLIPAMIVLLLVGIVNLFDKQEDPDPYK